MNPHLHFLVETALAFGLFGAGVALYAIRYQIRHLARELEGLSDEWPIGCSYGSRLAKAENQLDTLAANTKLRLEALTDRVSRCNEWLVSCHDLTGTVTRNDVDGSWTCGCGFGENRLQATEDTAYAAIQGFRAHAYRRKLEEARKPK